MKKKFKEKNVNNNRENRGITLIALVITIIVLLILAGVSIATLTGDNGILSKATDAKAKNEKATIEEEVKIALAAAKTSQLTGEQGDLAYLLGKELNGAIIDKDAEGNLKLRYKQNDITITKEGIIEGIESGSESDKDYALSNVKTLREEDKVYYMDYTADYKFNKFLAAGLTSEDEMIEFVERELLDGQDIEMAWEGFGCSTVAVKNEQGQTLFGRNLDLPAEMPSPAVITRTNPSNGDYASISTAAVGVLKDLMNGINADSTDEVKRQLLLAPYLPSDGMNEAGVSMAVLADEGAEGNGTKGIALSGAIRLVLDKAGNVDEAVKLLEEYNESIKINGFHFQIADATGKSVIVEYVNNEVKKIEKVKEEDYAMFCTNFNITKYMENESAVTVDERYKAIKKKVNDNKGILSEEDTMQLLDDVSAPGWTKWSVVYNSSNLTVDMVPHEDYSNKIKVSLFGRYKRIVKKEGSKYRTFFCFE